MHGNTEAPFPSQGYLYERRQQLVSQHLFERFTNCTHGGDPMYRTAHLLCLAALLVSLAARTTPASARDYFGINFGVISDWAGNFVYADAIKQSRGFKNLAGGDAVLDADGWPAEDFSVIVYHTVPHRDGLHRLYFEGQATVSCRYDISNQHHDAATNVTTADVMVLDDGAVCQLTFTNTSGGLRNVKLMRPREQGGMVPHDTASLFTDVALEIASKASTIRYMDLMAAQADPNGAGATYLGDWENRILPTDPIPGRMPGVETGYQVLGIPLEHIIALANQTHTDPYLCIFVTADDTYVRNLAQLFRDNLDPSLRIYVELSNEVWNSGFKQTSYCYNLGGTMMDTLNFDGGDVGQYRIGRRYLGYRTAQISMIFREVFGDGAMMTRVRPLIEWQRANFNQYGHVSLYFVDAFFNTVHALNSVARPVEYFIWGGGGAGYYGVNPQDRPSTIDEVFESGFMPPYGTAWNDEQHVSAMLAACYGMRHVVYEGGLATNAAGGGIPEQWVTPLRTDPRIVGNIVQHIEASQKAGNRLFVYYQAADRGPKWGLGESFNDRQTLPWKAVDSLSTIPRSAVSVGAAAGPGRVAVLEGKEWFACNANYGLYGGTNGKLGEGMEPGPQNVSTGSRYGYPFHAQAAGIYTITVHYTNGDGATMGIGEGGQVLQTQALTSSGATTPVEVELETERLHAVRITAESGSFTIDSITVLFVEALSVHTIAAKAAVQNHMSARVLGDHVVISWQARASGVTRLTVTDLLGRTQRVAVAVHVSGVDVSYRLPGALSPGRYVVRATGPAGRHSLCQLLVL